MNCLQIALNAIVKLLSSEDERREDFIRESRSRTGNKVRFFQPATVVSADPSIYRSRRSLFSCRFFFLARFVLSLPVL